MAAEQLARRAGQLGIAVSLLVWIASVPVLGFAMQANQAAWRGGVYRSPRWREARSLHTIAVLWSVVFVLLQLLAPLLLTFTLRAAYRWRSAVCFTIGAGCATLLDGLGLLGLLLWLRFQLGTG